MKLVGNTLKNLVERIYGHTYISIPGIYHYVKNEFTAPSWSIDRDIKEHTEIKDAIINECGYWGGCYDNI